MKMIQENISIGTKVKEQGDVLIDELTLNKERHYLMLTHKKSTFYEFLKKTTELIICILLIVLFSPVMIVTAAIIKIESKGSVIYRQERIGLNGKKIMIYKFRSMKVDAEKSGPQWAKINDTRITRVGMFIRKTRIDELPQLYNVIKGDLSLIGPRPEREYFINQFSVNNPDFHLRTLIKPGITGLAQVEGGYELSPDEKIEKDLYYIENRCYSMDLLILLKTILVVLTGNGAR